MAYDTFKTPFYEVSVGHSLEKPENMSPLPYQIARLIDKIEIKELLINPSCTFSQFIIHFIEGSREPYYKNSKATDYSDGEVELTNSTGLLSDLNFTQNANGPGISSISPSASGTINDVTSASTEAFQIASDITSSTSPKVITISSKKAIKKPITYLFQQRNRIKIRWGYLEDKDNAREIVGQIAAIEFDYSDNSMPTMTVTSVDPSAGLDQVGAMFGTPFYNKNFAGNSTTGKPTFSFSDLTIKEFIEKFSTKAGMAKPIVSDIFDSIKLDKHAIKILPAGMSMHQYLSNLANSYNAYYRCFIDPKTGDETIAFLDRAEYNSKLLFNDIGLTTYKQAGSIIKSVRLRAEFNVPNGAAHSGVTDDGKLTTVFSNASVTVGMAGSKAGIIDTDPTADNPIQAAKGSEKALNTPMATGTASYQPGVNDVEMTKRQVLSSAFCGLNNTVMISVSALGYPKLRPGPIFIGGIGQRFSGTFYFREVLHTIDDSGYTCRLEGSNQSDYGGVAKSNEQYKQTKEDESVTVPLTKPQASIESLENISDNLASSTSTASDSYSNAIG